MREQYKYVLDVDGNGWSGRFHRCGFVVKTRGAELIASAD